MSFERRFRSVRRQSARRLAALSNTFLFEREMERLLWADDAADDGNAQIPVVRRRLGERVKSTQRRPSRSTP